MPQILVAGSGLCISPRTVDREFVVELPAFAGVGAMAGVWLFRHVPDFAWPSAPR